jgi:hypothetical protein
MAAGSVKGRNIYIYIGSDWSRVLHDPEAISPGSRPSCKEDGNSNTFLNVEAVRNTSREQDGA